MFHWEEYVGDVSEGTKYFLEAGFVGGIVQIANIKLDLLTAIATVRLVICHCCPTADNNSIADAVAVLLLKKRRRWCEICRRETKTKTMTKDAHPNVPAGVRVHPPRHCRQ